MASDSNIKIRDVRADDAKAIMDIFRSSVRIIARRDYTQDQVLAWAPDEIDIAGWEGYATRRAFVAEDEKGPVGFADLEADGADVSWGWRARPPLATTGFGPTAEVNPTPGIDSTGLFDDFTHTPPSDGPVGIGKPYLPNPTHHIGQRYSTEAT